MVDGLPQLGVVSGLDDVAGGGCLVLDVGLLEDSLRLPTERFEDRDGLPALAGDRSGESVRQNMLSPGWWMLVPRLMARALLATLLVLKDSLEASFVRWPSVSLIITVAPRPWQGPC